jgi:hypothetical protein
LPVEGLDDLNELEDREVFEQALFHPKGFTAFLKNHWNHAYFALLAFHIQPILPGLLSCVIHALRHCKGKQTDQSLKGLFQLQSFVEGCFGFQVVGLAFVGHSIYSELHINFKMQCEAQLTRGSWELRTKSLLVVFYRGSARSVVIPNIWWNEFDIDSCPLLSFPLALVPTRDSFLYQGFNRLGFFRMSCLTIPRSPRCTTCSHFICSHQSPSPSFYRESTHCCILTWGD